MEKTVNNLKRKLEEHEAKQAEAAKVFNVDEVLRHSGECREIFVPELNQTVKYGVLTLADLAVINKTESSEEKAIVILWKMLNKADPHVTLEKIRELPLDVATSILTAIAAPLQQTQKRLQSGLPTVRKPNLSV